MVAAIDGRSRGGRVFAANGDLENGRHKLEGAVVFVSAAGRWAKENERNKVRKVASVGAPCETGEKLAQELSVYVC